MHFISEDESRITDRCKCTVEDRLWKDTEWIFDNPRSGLEPRDISGWISPYTCSNCMDNTFFDFKRYPSSKRICSVCESLLRDIRVTEIEITRINRIMQAVEGKRSWRSVCVLRLKVVEKRKNKLENFYKLRNTSGPILILLNHHILPNDLIRMTKGFLY